MSRPHHSHAHAVAADESAHGTSASPPPPRNSVEDADASFTRKRPRLHSGGTSIRAMSTDPLSASPQEQQVEMTIRPHPPSSPASGHAEEGSDVDDLLLDAQPDEAGLPVPGENMEDPSRSPPIMVIDDDDDDDDDDDEVDAGFSIQLDAEDYFRQFPYASRGDYSDAVHGLPQHFQGCTCCCPHLEYHIMTNTASFTYRP
jgi:ubiquitin carboxyl-terminal hydrolase 34